MSVHRQSKRENGFTLIELLVVVAIIIILMALLIPLAGQARVTAHTKKCLSNMRQIGAAITVAQSDFGGAFPCVSFSDFRTGGSPPGSVSLIQVLRPYLPVGMIKLKNGQEWIDEKYTCQLYRNNNNTYGDYNGWGFGAYAYSHAFRGNNETPPKSDPWPDDLAGRHASQLAGNKSQGNPTLIDRWTTSTYGIVWDNGWLNPTPNTTPHDFHGIPGHHPEYNVLFADLHAATHKWVHHWGLIGNQPPPVPREYRDDLSSVTP